jgi:nicotinamide-nucleotide amidase
MQKIEPVEKIILERLGTLVYGYEDEELEMVVHQLLEKKGKTISTAESVTGGMLASKLTKVPGASSRFFGGVVTYTNEIKKATLGITDDLLAGPVACNPELTLAMARAVRKKLGTHIGLATTGVAGPGDVSPELPQGKVFVALSSDEGEVQQTYQWFGSRNEIQSRTTKLALNILRLHLLGVE